MANVEVVPVILSSQGKIVILHSGAPRHHSLKARLSQTLQCRFCRPNSNICRRRSVEGICDQKTTAKSHQLAIRHVTSHRAKIDHMRFFANCKDSVGSSASFPDITLHVAYRYSTLTGIYQRPSVKRAVFACLSTENV